jgi:hypothetical protein
MENLTPESRQDRNGKMVTRWVRKLTGRGPKPELPSPAPITPDLTQRSAMDTLASSLPTRREGIDKAAEFIVHHGVDSESPSGERNEGVESFLLKMEESTLRQITEFIDDKENGFVVRSMCATMISGMALRYRGRKSDFGIDYTQLHNLMLLGEDFQRSTPENFLYEAKANLNFNTVRDLTVRFENLMGDIKPQNLSKTPDFGTLSDKEQRRTRVALVIANVYYTGADNGQRHRESELLDCIDRHFDRRFEITPILDRIMDATPSVIDENMEIRVASMQEGWL